MDPDLLVAEGAGTSQVTAAALLTAAGLLLVGGVATAAVVSAAVPRAEANDIEVYGEKLAHVSSCAVRYDVVVVGNSRSYRAVAPPAIETALAGRGAPAKVYNLSAPSLIQAEQHELVAALAGCAPRLVLIDPDLETYDDDNWAGERRMFLQTWGRAWKWAGRTAAQSTLPGVRPDRRLSPVVGGATHLGSAAARSVGFGAGSRALFPAPPDARRDYAQPTTERGGWVSLEEEPSEGVKRRRAIFEADLEAFEARLAEPVVAGEHALTEREKEDLRMLKAAVESSGAQVAWLLSPSTTPSRRRQALQRGLPALGAPVLDYTRGGAYTEIYQAEWWFDRSHLTRVGAERFGAQLARDLAGLL